MADQKPQKLWYVYLLKCADGSLYTGITVDLKRRVAEHNGEVSAKQQKGAAYTRARRPVALFYHEQLPNRSAASKREAAIKKLPRSAKLLLAMQ